MRNCLDRQLPTTTYNFEPVLFVQGLEHGEGEFPVELQSPLISVQVVINPPVSLSKTSPQLKLGAVQEDAGRFDARLRARRNN